MAVLNTYRRPTVRAQHGKYLIRKETTTDHASRPWMVRQYNDSLDLWMRLGSFAAYTDAVEHVKKLLWLNNINRKAA